MAAKGMEKILRICPETTYGALPGSPTWTYILQDNDDGPILKKTIQQIPIRAAHVSNRRIQLVGERHSVAGTLNTLVWPLQAATLVSWGADITSVANELPSYTVQEYDGVRRRSWGGVKVSEMVWRSEAESQIVQLSLSLMGQTSHTDPTDVEFPIPGEDLYTQLAQLPYTHQNCNALKIGTTRTKFESIEFRIRNMLQGKFDENAYISALTYHGRDVDMVVGMAYTASTDTTAYEAGTAQDVEATWTRGGQSVKFDMHVTNYFFDDTKRLPLAGRTDQTLNIAGFFSGSALDTDLTVTIDTTP